MMSHMWLCQSGLPLAASQLKEKTIAISRVVAPLTGRAAQFRCEATSAGQFSTTNAGASCRQDGRRVASLQSQCEGRHTRYPLLASSSWGYQVSGRACVVQTRSVCLYRAESGLNLTKGQERQLELNFRYLSFDILV